MKRRWWIVLLIIIVLIGGGLLWNRMTGQKAQSQVMDMKITDSKLIMTVERGALSKKISASGNLTPVQEKDLLFSLNGKVAEMLVAEGERVKLGQELARLEKNQQELNYLRAKSSFEAAKIKGSSTEILEQELNLKIAKENLDATTLKAPFAGLVTDLFIETGDQVVNGKAVVRLMDDSSYEIEVNIDEVDSHLVAEGQPVIITLDALPGQRFKGIVSEIAYRTAMSNGVVTLPVKVTLREGNADFKPGFSTDLEIIVSKVEDQLIVPITAVFTKEGQERVVKVVDGKPEPTPVKTGISNGTQVVIEKGLEPGDQILINTFRFTGSNSGNELQFRMGPGGGPGGRRGGM